MKDNKTSEAADNLLFSIEERSKIPSPVASWIPPMLAVIQKYKKMEEALDFYSHFSPAEMGNLSQVAIEALSFDPLS